MIRNYIATSFLSGEWVKWGENEVTMQLKTYSIPRNGYVALSFVAPSMLILRIKFSSNTVKRT